MLRTIPSLTPGSSGSATVPPLAGGPVGDPGPVGGADPASDLIT
jgi:hypothetical protein